MLQLATRQKIVSLLSKLHDLWIILGWGGILAAIFLNTYFHRSCTEFVDQQFATATCQTGLDWLLIFLAAVGGGMVIWDERVGILGFLFAHAVATTLFLVALFVPIWFGAVTEALTDTVLAQAVVLAALYQFPFGLFFSFIGGIIGLWLGSKLPTSGENIRH